MSLKAPRVVYLGPEGTYTHQAAIQEFGDSATLIAEKSINGCFKILDDDEVDYAVVPFENSTNGQVTFTYDLLRDWLIPPEGVSKKSQFQVVAEQFVSIHHCLLTHAKDVSEISKLYTHPQAWGQCSDWLLEFGGGIDRIDSSSTSKAAEIAAKEGFTSAAIASAYASEIHKLPILHKNIENVKNNTTRFLILSKKEAKAVEDSQYITLLAFTVAHNDPGALARALNILSKNGINLASITSRPSLIKAWQYVFFIEFWGDNLHDVKIQKVVKEFSDHCLTSSKVGTFPRNKRYFETSSNAAK